MSLVGIFTLAIVALQAQEQPGGLLGLGDGIQLPASEPEFTCPVVGGGSISYGNGDSPSHLDSANKHAWDYNIPTGHPVVASRSGIVVSVINQSSVGGGDRKWVHDKNEVRIRHSDGTESVYLHFLRSQDPPRLNEFVLRGELIGHCGQTGWAWGPHLHYCVHKDRKSIASKFADFDRRDGVPVKGDFHKAPQPPHVPQELINRYKALWRSMLRAVELEVPDVAIALIDDGRKKLTADGYYYHKKALALAEQALSKVTRELERMEGSATLTQADLGTAERYELALAAHRELRARARSLTRREVELDRAALRDHRAASSNWKTYLAGLKEDCRDEFERALVSYAKAAKRQSVLRPVIEGRIDAMIAIEEKAHGQRVARLLSEKRRAESHCLPDVMNDAEQHFEAQNRFWKAVAQVAGRKGRSAERRTELARERAEVLD